MTPLRDFLINKIPDSIWLQPMDIYDIATRMGLSMAKDTLFSSIVQLRRIG